MSTHLHHDFYKMLFYEIDYIIEILIKKHTHTHAYKVFFCFFFFETINRKFKECITKYSNSKPLIPNINTLALCQYTILQTTNGQSWQYARLTAYV